MKTENNAQTAFVKEIKRIGFRPYISKYGDVETADFKILESGQTARVVTYNEGETKQFAAEVTIVSAKSAAQEYTVKFSFGTPASVIVNFLNTL